MHASRSKGWHNLWTLTDPPDLTRWRHQSGLTCHIFDNSAVPNNVDMWTAACANVPPDAIIARLRSLLIECRDMYDYQLRKHEYNKRKAEKLAR